MPSGLKKKRKKMNLCSHRGNMGEVINKEIGINIHTLLYIGEGNGNPLQYSCLGYPKERSLVGYSPCCCRVRNNLATEHTLSYIK